MDHVEVHAGPATGFLIAIRRLASAIVAHLAARADLLAVELQEEKQRIVGAMVAAVATALAALLALCFTGVVLIVSAWDTGWWLPTAIVVPAVFALIAIGSFAWLRHLVSQQTAMFKTSIRELRRDAEELRG